MHTFDMQALHTALDDARNARNLSWVELAADINQPFQGTTSIPISVSTIQNMSKKSSVVLQVLRWLDRSPESFLSGRVVEQKADEKLPDLGAARILRFDTQAIYAALDDERRRRNLTWRQLVAQLPGFTQSMVVNLAEGPLIGFPDDPYPIAGLPRCHLCARSISVVQWIGPLHSLVACLDR